VKQLDEIAPELVARGAVAVARAGLDVDDLDDVVEELEAEVKRIAGLHTKPDRAEALAVFGTSRRPALVALQRERPELVDALFTRLGAGPGLAEGARELRSSIRKAAKASAFAVHRGGSLPSTATFAARVGDELDVFAVPERWACSERGVFELVVLKDGGVMDKQIAHRPIVITRTFRELLGAASWVELAWPNQGGTWTRKRVGRGVISSARELVSLAAFGAPVHSENAAALVRWLAEFEAANPTTASATVSTRCGWQHGTRDFLVGGLHVAPEGAEPVELFTDDDPGLEQVLRSFVTSGTFSGWKRVFAAVADQPVAVIMVYASCVAPLLEILGAPNFLVDVHGVSGHGKTTVLRLAASVWGQPEDGRAIYSWASTPTAVERTLGALSGLPVCLDESNRVPLRDRPQIASTAYMIGNGSGKGRGTLRGSQRRVEFHTVVLSTGEASIASYTEDEGVRGRCVPVYGPPLGSADQAEALRVGVAENYGHLGRALVRYLVDLDDDGRAKLRARYHEAREQFGNATQRPMVRRAAQYLAAMLVAAELVHGPLGVAKPTCNVWGFVKEQVTHAATAADRPLSALRDLVGWALASGRLATGPEAAQVPPGGWLGRFESMDRWRWVALLPDAVKTWLKQHGHEPEAVLRQLADRGLLVKTEGHLTAPVRLPGQGFASRLFKFDRAKLEEHGILTSNETP
jgi:hypothetical protein